MYTLTWDIISNRPWSLRLVYRLIVATDEEMKTVGRLIRQSIVIVNFEYGYGITDRLQAAICKCRFSLPTRRKRIGGV